MTVLGLAFALTHCAVSFHDYPVGDMDASVAGGNGGATSSDASAGSSGSSATGGSGGTAAGGSGGTVGGGGTVGSGGSAGTAGAAGSGGTGGAAGSGGAGGGTVVPPLLVSDGNTEDIYALDESGTVLDQYTSPVSGVRGVAHDRSARDGFWVVGTGDLHDFYKLDWSGTLLKKLAVDFTMASSPRGLDYMVDPKNGNVLVMIGTEGSPSFDALRTYGLKGNSELDGSFVDNGSMLSGVWGVSAVGPAGLLTEEWTTWNDNTLQLWSGFSRSQTVSTTLSNLRGIDRDANGDFWVVAGTQIAHLDSTGKTLGTFAAPGPDPQGLSHSR